MMQAAVLQQQRMQQMRQEADGSNISAAGAQMGVAERGRGVQWVCRCLMSVLSIEIFRLSET